MVNETVKLTRNDSKPWGFRLAGGKDFGVILTVQKVSPGSLAAETGLQSGDAVVSINGVDTADLRHKEAQDVVLKAGNSLEITIQRGGASNWKPPGSQKITSSTSETTQIRETYTNATSVYSMNTIAETLTAHAEMIAPGVMGINFMKPEHPVNTMSEVYRLVQEEEQNKAKSPTPPKTPTTPPILAPRRSAPLAKTPPPVAPKPVSTPVQHTVNASPTIQSPLLKKPTPPAQSHGSCSDCGRYITSNFVRVGEKILHEDCFRCSTCGSSLQSTGYVNLNNKLYCEIHAKLAAKVIASEILDSSPTPIAEFQKASPAAPITPQPLPTSPHLAPAQPPPMPLPPMAAPPMPAPPMAAPPMAAPTMDTSFKSPAPYIPPGSQNLGNLPQTPSSSGGLTFRSISPQPFKRISGDFHRVTAPTSPTPSSTPSYSYEPSGPLPFETKPYMPSGQSLTSLQTSSSQISQSSQQVSQSYQQTTTVTQQASQFQVDYKQVVGQQRGTKFIWPPPKPEDMLPEQKSDSALSTLPHSQQHYSPLATQSSPPESQTKSNISAPPPAASVPAPPAAPEIPASQTKPTAPAPFVPPPLPSTFSKPPEQETSQPTPLPASEPKPAAPPADTAPVTGIAPGFAPVLPPVVDDSKKEGAGTVPQSGVPTGAGSRPAPRRGKGQLKEQIPGCRIPICADCGSPIRGPFIIALGKTWCPEHFHCNNLHCKRALQDTGFVEEQGQLYCENCYEAFLAPICNKCGSRIKGDCLNALGKSWHPECFICSHCHKPFGNSSFYLEDALPYCEKDWNELFTTKCVGCGYPIEAGDRWVEALNNNYHSQCFKCSICSKNLEGQSFYAKGGRPFCKAHAR